MSVFSNHNELFSDANLAQINTFAEWSDTSLEEARRTIEELLEKREAIFEEGFGPRETSYYWTSYILRRLGYTFSVAESDPENEAIRFDFTLFTEPEDFNRGTPYRGSREFFEGACAMLRSLEWTDSLDEQEVEGAPANPAFDVDRYLRNTGVQWGILTNGRYWRLFNRDTSGQLTTFFEVDLMAALQSANIDDFKYFWMVFSPKGLGGKAPIVSRLVN